MINFVSDADSLDREGLGRILEGVLNEMGWNWDEFSYSQTALKGYLNILLDGKSDKLCGSLINKSTFITFGIDRVNKEWRMRAPFKKHILKAIRIDKGEVKTDPKIVIVNNLEAQKEAVKILIQEAGSVAFDIETERGRVQSISFTPSPNMAIVVPLVWQGKYVNDSQDNENRWSLIRWVFQNAQKLAGHNSIYYDNLWLFNAGVPYFECADTQVMMNLVYPELPKTLDFCTTFLTDYSYYGDKAGGGQESRWEYNGMDTIVTYHIYHHLLKVITQNKELKLYEGLHSLQPIIHRIHQAGLDINKTKYRQQQNLLLKSVQELEAEYPDLNINSPKQIMEAVNNLNARKDGTHIKKYSIDNAQLDTIKKRQILKPDPLITNILKRKQISTIYNKYFKECIDKGKLPVGCSLSSNEDGLFICGENAFSRGCVDIVSMPDELKLCIESPRGEVFFKIGSHSYKSQILKHLIPITKQDIPPHILELCMGKSMLAVTREFKLNRLELGREWQRFCAVNYTVKPFLERIEKQLRKTLMMTNAFGRTREFVGCAANRVNQGTVRDAISFIVESTVNDWISFSGLVGLPQNCTPLLHGHNWLLISVGKKDFEKVAGKLFEAMRKEIVWDRKEFGFKVDIVEQGDKLSQMQSLV